jgi:molybdopterin-guanine dinucleotide biosynthesis protein A
VLFEGAEGKDGAVPFVNGFFEPLHAVYHRERCLKVMARAIKEGNYSILDLYPYLELALVDKQKILEFDPDLRSFFNINELDDLGKGGQ